MCWFGLCLQTSPYILFKTMKKLLTTSKENMEKRGKETKHVYVKFKITKKTLIPVNALVHSPYFAFQDFFCIFINFRWCSFIQHTAASIITISIHRFGFWIYGILQRNWYFLSILYEIRMKVQFNNYGQWPWSLRTNEFAHQILFLSSL